jgi:RNA polymerase primary sigma factor
MYMREMGSVELLTAEGEIEIAKRIEDGLRHMIQAISACPTTIAEILSLADRIEKDELRVDEVVDGLVDPTAADEPIAEIAEEEEEIEEELDAAEEEDEEGSNAPTADQLKLKADAAKRFASIRSLYHKMTRALRRMARAAAPTSRRAMRSPTSS